MFSQVNIFPKALTILDATSEVNNNNAYRQQEEGMLNNYILYMPIILFEEDLRKLKLRF